MGVDRTAYAGFGIKIDFSNKKPQKVATPSCNCEDKGGGKFCGECGKKIEVKYINSVDDVCNELNDVLSEAYYENEALGTLTFLGDNYSGKTFYVGHFYRASEYSDHMIPVELFPDPEEAWNEIQTKFKELLPDHMSLLDRKHYGFYVIDHAS